MGRSTTLPLVLIAAGAVACVSAGLSLWRQAHPAPATPVAVVSGSSLAETLLGDAVRGTCSDCGFPLRFAIESLPSSGEALCPNCGGAVATADLVPKPPDRVALEALAESEAPRLGGLYVFSAPEGGAAAPVVKRIVAGPGQRVTIDGGDLFLDGDRVRKDPRDDAFPRIVVHEERPGLDDSVGPSPWVLDPRPDDRVVREFRPRATWSIERSPVAVLDSYPSQAVERRRLNPVADIWMSCILEREELDAEFVYRAGEGDYALLIDDVGRWKLEAFELTLARGELSDWTRRETLRFGMLDRQIFLVRPGKESIVVPTGMGTLPPSLAPLSVMLPSRATVSNLRVERDLHYLPPIGAEEPWVEAAGAASDGWFALGDYPSYSTDSRHFGRLPRASILGEARLPAVGAETQR